MLGFFMVRLDDRTWSGGTKLGSSSYNPAYHHCPPAPISPPMGLVVRKAQREHSDFWHLVQLVLFV